MRREQRIKCAPGQTAEHAGSWVATKQVKDNDLAP